MSTCKRMSLDLNAKANLETSKILALRLGENLTPIPMALNGFKGNLAFVV